MRELEGVRALLCVPTYGMLDPMVAKYVRVAMMNAAHRGLLWEGDTSPDRMSFAAARNSAAQQLLEGGKELADGIVWLDSDIVCEPNSISALVDTAIHYKHDFVSGVYHKRGGKNDPVFYHYKRSTGKFYIAREYPENMLIPIEGCGFGIVWTSWELIHRIAMLPTFDPKRGWFPDDRDSGGFGEDLNFCAQAMKADVQLYVNTAIQVGHLGDPHIVTRDHYLASMDKPDEGNEPTEKEKGLGYDAE